VAAHYMAAFGALYPGLEGCKTDHFMDRLTELEIQPLVVFLVQIVEGSMSDSGATFCSSALPCRCVTSYCHIFLNATADLRHRSFFNIQARHSRSRALSPPTPFSRVVLSRLKSGT